MTNATADAACLPLFDFVQPADKRQLLATVKASRRSSVEVEALHVVNNLVLYAQNTFTLYERAMEIYAAFKPTGQRTADEASLSLLFRPFLDKAIRLYRAELGESPGDFSEADKDLFCRIYACDYYSFDRQQMLAEHRAVPPACREIRPFSGRDGNVKRVDPAIIGLLSRARAEEDSIFINTGELDRKTYNKVDAVLKQMGGRWDKKRGAHVFPFDPAEKLDLLLTLGEVEVPDNLGFFPTPASLADRIIALADIQPGMTVLEPSAGTANLADRAARIVGTANVSCCELQEANRDLLQQKGYAILADDFLSLDATQAFHRVIMNPPFARSADVQHVTHALGFLEAGGRLVSVMSSGILYRADHRTAEFRDHIAALGGDISENPPGSFRESGTNCSTVTVVVDIPQ